MSQQRKKIQLKINPLRFLSSAWLFTIFFNINERKILGVKAVEVENLHDRIDVLDSSEFFKYTLIFPEIENESKTLDNVNFLYMPNITMTFDHNGQRIYIDLKRNDKLLPDDHFLQYQNSKETSGYVIKNFRRDNEKFCHYQGSIRGKLDSRAAVSICNGKISGTIFDTTETYVINALKTQTLQNQHFLVKASDLRVKNATCGHKNTEEILRDKRSIDDSTLPHGPFKANKKSLYVELIIVADNGLYKSFEEHIGKTHQYCKDLANIINALYAPLNIFVILTGVVIWTEKDEIVFDTDARETLDRFLEYRIEKLIPEHPHDHAHLLTIKEFDYNVVGKAFVGQIGTYEKSGAVISVHSSNSAVVGTTMAHEMGHSFGMLHDTSDCKCPDKKCIMSDTSSSYIPTHWSNCSIKQLTGTLSRGSSFYLRNKPTKIFESPECGNGFVEPGEECDCGLPGYCKSNCCNPKTCRLYSNATCGSGDCCDLKNCRPKAIGTECRHADNECDLPEFCTGKSEFCPRDVYKVDAADCDNGKAFCFQGKCRSQQDQCRLLWGPKAFSQEHCYREVNGKGNVFGNCGFDYSTNEFIKCNRDDVQCGKLMCDYPSDTQEWGLAAGSQMNQGFVLYNRSYISCRSAHFNLSFHVPDPSMTPNGFKCGDTQMCYEQKCVSLEDLRMQGVIRKCRENCNGNGVCNSEGNCHCDIGFSGSTCRAPGPGGSIDSGPATNPRLNEVFRRFLYIFFCGVVPFMLCFHMFICFYRNHPCFKRHSFKKCVDTPISEVISQGTSAADSLINPVVNARLIERQRIVAKSVESLQRVITQTSVENDSSVNVHVSTEKLTENYRNSYISKSASNYELSTLVKTTPSVSCKDACLTVDKKSYKAIKIQKTGTDPSLNNTLRSKLEITDIRLQSSTNPLAVALTNGAKLIESGSKDNLNDL